MNTAKYFVDVRFNNNTPSFWVRLFDNVTSTRAYEILTEWLDKNYGNAWCENADSSVFYDGMYGEYIIARILPVELMNTVKLDNVNF